jgi:hypothetical protein
LGYKRSERSCHFTRPGSPSNSQYAGALSVHKQQNTRMIWAYRNVFMANAIPQLRRIGRVKPSDPRSEVLPSGSAPQPGKKFCHFQIASLGPDQRSGLARSKPVK